MTEQFSEQFIVRDMRRKEKYFIDDVYLDKYAQICGVYATAIYNSLGRHANFATQKCFPRIDKMAREHHISRPSVIKGLNALKRYNIIQWIGKKDNKGKWAHNVYTLLDKSLWLPANVQVSQISKPSKPHSKNQVNYIDCKDNSRIKDNNYNDNRETINKMRALLVQKLTIDK